MKLYQFIFAFLLCIQVTVAYTGSFEERVITYQLERFNRTDCTYYFDTSNTQDGFSIICFLQGSEITSVRNFMRLADCFWLKKNNVAVLAVEKPGVSQDDFDRKTYLAMNSLWQRAEDCLKVVEILREKESAWNGKLLLVGASEGATLAAYLSTLIPEIKATIMFSGGCGMSLHDELQLLENKKVRVGYKGFLRKYFIKAYIYTMISVAKFFPNSSYTCIGENNTLRHWNTIGNYNPLTSLEKLDTPLYLVQGTRDTDCPIESARKLVAYFAEIKKTNLTYREYKYYDHNFFDLSGENHWQEVADEAFLWVETYLKY